MELKSAISLLLLVTALSGCWGKTVHQHERMAKKPSVIPSERKDVQPKVPTVPMDGQKADIEPRLPMLPRGLTDPHAPVPRHLDGLSGSYMKEPKEQGKIIGGAELRPNQWPYLVLVRLNHTASATVVNWCGGSIIDSTHVLSAAHCYQMSRGVSYIVVAGEHNSSANEGTEQTRKVVRVFNHPNYTSQYENDVAVLRLDSALQLNNRVAIVAYNNDSTCPVVNATCSVSGWGFTIEDDRNSASKVPMTVEVPIRPQSACSNIFRPYSDKQICAGNNGHDACSGDSGGPMMCQCGGRNQLTGVVSYGYGDKCGQGAFPGVYTRVSSHLNWFVEVVNGVHDNRADTYNYHDQENIDV